MESPTETAQGCESFSIETWPETVSALAAYCEASEKNGDCAEHTMAPAARSSQDLVNMFSPSVWALTDSFPLDPAPLVLDSRLPSLPLKLLLQVGCPLETLGRVHWNQQFPPLSA